MLEKELVMRSPTKGAVTLTQIVEMVRTPFGTAYIVLSNGETHPVTDSQASSIENFFEGK